MKLNFAVIVCFFVLLKSGFVSAEEAVKYPVVIKFNGTAQILAKNEEARALKVGEVLKEKARLRTKAKSQLQIDLDAHTSLTLLENSELEIPVIDWDTGETTEVQLRSGSMRVNSQSDNQRFYTTPLSKDIYTQADFILAYNPNAAKVTMTCLREAVDFRGFEGETTARVGAGEKSTFLGVSEAGTLSFDVLLKGRKVARGKLSAVEKVSAVELQSLQSAAVVQKPVASPKPPKAPRQADQICDEPYGKLNECLWTCEGLPKHSKKPIKSCEGHECVRKRCDANGAWSDEFKTPASEGKCDVQAKVAPCDY